MHLYKTLFISAAVCASFILPACSSDEPEMIDPRPGLENVEQGVISSFSIDNDSFSLPEGTQEVEIILFSCDNEAESQTFSFSAQVEAEAKSMRYHMHMPASSALPDGKYVMTVRIGDKNVGGRRLVQFMDRQLTSHSIILPSYMLPGSGTEEDPYVIAGSEDFEMFIINLQDDKDAYGCGLFFKQTADVTPSDQSILAPGRGYWGAPFAGNYDGGGNEIRNLYYRGSGREGSDKNFGLFTELRGSACVKNIKFTGVDVSGLQSDSGILAGKTNGNVWLNDISISGHIEGTDDSYAIGGVVGRQKSGIINMSGIQLSASISGGNDVGGLVGCAEGQLDIHNVSTPDYHFSVEGHHSVGGLIGRAKGKYEISDVKLEHKVTNEDSDIRIVQATGTGAGGIIGTVTSDVTSGMLSNVRVGCPVGGIDANSVGGLVGSVSQQGTLGLDDCRVYSVVSGNENVGGAFGNVNINTSDGISFISSAPSVRVAVDDADAFVQGASNVGGFAGCWHAPITDAKDLQYVQINAPVKATDKNCGGVFGVLNHTTISNTQIFAIGEAALNPSYDDVMRVSGGNNVGGFAGYVVDSYIYGPNKYDMTSGSKAVVPDISRLKTLFSCVAKGSECVGSLVGYAENSELHYLYSNGRAEGTKYVGGIVGQMIDTGYSQKAVIEDCAFNGSLNSPDADCMGGVAGMFLTRSTGFMTDCVNYAKVTGADDTGGVVGYFRRAVPNSTLEDWAVLKWCVNTGAVSGTMHVGGVAGRISCDDSKSHFKNDETLAVDVHHCMNTGAVEAAGGNSNSASSGVGGIVGFTNSRIAVANSSNHGSVYARGSVHGIGGVAGSMGEDPTGTGITNSFRNVSLYECSNSATISSGSSSSFVGGVLGYQEEGNKSDVEDCYNTGSIPSKLSHDCGGIVGCVDHMTNIYRTFNSGKVDHGNAAIGTHKSASLFDHGQLYYLDGTGKSWPSASKVSQANIGKESSYKGFDFEKIWVISDDGPRLRDCPWQYYQ